jgi:hypothetical protein
VKRNFEREHIQRLHAQQERLARLSDRQLLERIARCEALQGSEAARYPSDWWTHPCEHWSTPEERTAWWRTRHGSAWWHSKDLQAALCRERVECERIIRQRQQQTDAESILGGPRLEGRSVLGT